MQLTAKLKGQTHNIDLRREELSVKAEIDGRHYEASAFRIEKDVVLFVVDGRTYECRIHPSRTNAHLVTIQVGGEAFSISLIDPKRLRRGDESNGHKDSGAAEISSPMAGKVVRVLVEQGAQVKSGDGIVVVEAMKMQNELKSPFDGIVSEMRAEAGSTVNSGEVLAIVEARV